ncbi:MAG: LamG domain-containing protein, partial [Planctomycetota bacterium]
MCKKLIYLISAVLVLCSVLTSPAKAADPSLVGWWRLDDGSGTTVTDFSGNGNDGAFRSDPQWVAGKIGGALQFDGVDDFVEVPHAEILTVDKEVTVMAWINTERYIGPTGADWQGIMAKGANPGRSYSLYTQVSGALHFSTGGIGTLSTVLVPLNEWVHAAAQVIDGGHQYYINGEDAGRGGSGITLPGAADTATVRIGTARDANREFLGMLDDVRIYNRALSQEEVQNAMVGEGLPQAFAPDPKDGGIHPDTWITLSWRPGDFAVSHDVYLGDNFDDVSNATHESETFRGNQASAFFVAGFPGFAYPDGLVPGTTYYWRVDEVNDAEPDSPWKGDVWSFSVPPKKAYNPNPADGAESVALDARLTWTAGFGAKLHTVYFGDNFDDVSNAAGGLPQGGTTYTPGPLRAAKTYYWRVDEFDAVATHKGDVWMFSTEGAVGNPYPANGAVGVEATPILTWAAGYLAASHEVYFGADSDAVANATSASPEYKGTKALGDESYDPGALLLDTAYYWRIDEVNNAQPDSPWIGNIWSFTTGNFYVVDDFESYNDIDPPDAASNRIFDNWIDGFGTTDNGSLVGNDLPPYAEQTTVHGGSQSMPYRYDNNLKSSEATLTLASPRDWTKEGVSELSIWFHGLPGSVGSFVEAPAGTFTMTASGTDIWDVGTAGAY